MPLPDQDILINSNRNIGSPDPVIQLPEISRVESPDTGSGAFTESKKALNEYLGLLAPVKPAAQSIGDIRTYKPEDVAGAGRYKQFILGQDNENLNANLQSTWDKFGNAFVKMAGTAGTTFLEGTVGAVYGIGSMINNQRAAAFYDNDFNNALNDWSSKTLEDALPNYYTAREREGHWYEPANLFTANFFFDKIMKNLGFAMGAVASGGVWGGAFKAIGLAGKLVKTGQNLEQAIAAMETELAAIPAASRGSKALEMLQQFGRDAVKNVIAKPLTKADRFITAGMGTLGEASIEAMNNLNQYRSALIDKYTEENGISPTGADLEEINKSADGVGNSTFLLNTALLSVSNYIQFPRILNSTYKADKAIINGVETNAVRQGKDGIVKSVFSEKNSFSKLLSRSQKLAGLFFNPSEGVEEISQDAVQLGTQNYFNRKREGKDVEFWRDMIAGGVEQANTEQGWQDFVIGALSGGLMTGRSHIQERGPFGQGGYKGKATAQAISALNEFSFEKALNQRLRSVERAQIAQENRTKAIRQGDILESKDEEYNFTHEYLMSRIKYGRFDFVKQDIDNAKNEAATPEAFDQLKADGKIPEGDDINTYLQRLSNLEEHANNVKSLYDSLNTRYGGLVLTKDGKPVLDENNKPIRKYSDDVIDKMVYAASKVKDYDTRIPQLSSNLLSKGVNVQEVINGISEGKTESLASALETINKLDVLGETKEELKQELKDVAELSLRRKTFLKEYDNIRENPDKFEQKEEKPAPAPTPAETKTLDIDKQIMDLVSSDENYNNWSNVRDKTDLAQFQDQITSAIAALDTVKNKATSETIDDYLKNIKAFSNKELRERIVNLLVEKYASQVNIEKAAELKRIQDELSKKSGNTSTGENEADQAAMPREEAKKTLYALINSTTEPTDPAQRKDWMDRHQAFLANFSKIRNRNEIQAVKITKANEAAWGLTGIVSKVNNGFVAEDKLTDKTDGVVVIVYVKKNKAGELVLVDKKGNILKTGGDILNEAIYSTMGDANRFWSEKYNNKDGTRSAKYRNTESPEVVEAAYSAYEKEREDVFSRGTKEDTKAYGFVIQEGKPILDENPQAKNPVVGSILNDQKLLDNKNLVQVSTIGTISTSQGQNFNVPLGRPVLVTSSGISFLNNRNFTEEEAINITNALKQLSKDGLNAPDITRYLQGQFQWRAPGPSSQIGNNQLYIDELTQEIKLGETVLSSFNPDLIEINREHIQAQIQKAYNNVNNEFLTTEFEQPFNELSIDKDGKISTTKWKNYQHYLLSNTLPQGGQRTGVPPLFTRVRMIEKDNIVENDFNIRRYSVLEDLEVPKVEIVKKEEKQPEKPSGNTFTLGGGEIISYSFDENQEIVLINNGELIKALGRIKRPEFNEEIDNIKKTIKEQKGEDVSDDVAAKSLIVSAITKNTIQEDKPAAVVTLSLQQKLAASRANAATKDGKSEYRTIGSLGARRMTKAEHEKFAKWMALNLPNVPFERVMNVIEKTNGGYAWGVFEDGMIKIFENAATGTEYHEAFEAVWNSFLTSKEQTFIINEYKLQNKSKSSSLSNEKIKENIADKFSEYILSEKPTSIAGHIRKFFNDLISFFRNLINKPQAIDQLFKRINTGYYSSREVNNNVDAAYNSIPDIDQQVLNETIDHITASVMRDLAANTDNFFNNFKNISLTKLFDNAKDELNKRIDGIITAYDDLLNENPGEVKPITEAIENYYTVKENIDKNWNKIIDQEIEYLKTFNINVKEDEEIDFNDENRTGVSFKKDVFKIDAKTSSPTAIKLLFATLTNNLRENLIVSNGKVLEMPNESKSETINGLQTAPFGKSFVQVLEALTGKNDLKDIIDSLVTLAKKEPNYVKLFKRLRGSIITGKIDYSSLSSNDWRLLINFYNTFTKQKPVALIQYVGENGAYIESADLNDVISSTVSSWMPKIRENVNKENGVIHYNSEKDLYSINKEALSSIGNHFQQLALLKRIGVPFSIDDYNALPSDGKRDFANAVARIKNTFAGLSSSKTLTQKWLDVAGPLNTLSRLSNSLEVPELSSIFYDHNNEQRQQYVLNNYLSSFANDFNNVKSLSELLEKKKYLNDVFSTNSQILKKGGQFFDETGKRTDKPLRIGTILANINKQIGKSTDISKLQKGSRVMMEINNNIKGWSYNLSTSDSGTEWIIELGNTIAQASFNSEDVWSEITPVFQGYLNDEIALIQENRNNILYTSPRASKLRFMDDILSPTTTGAIEAAIKSGKIATYLVTNQVKINDEIKGYFTRKTEALKSFLAGYNEIISSNGIVFSMPNLAAQKNRFTETELNNFLRYNIVNNTINSIELHKIFYGDPYQFKVTIDKATGKPTLDETKRIKSGGSPKETTFNNTEFDNSARIEKNHLLSPDDIGWTAFKPYINTVTIGNIIVRGSLADENSEYEKIDEADSSAWMSFPFYRQMELKRGSFSDEGEVFFQHDMARARRYFHDSPAYEYRYSSDELQEADNEILKEDQPDFKISVIKPLVYGPAYGKDSIQLVMDKDSVMPLTFDSAKWAGKNQLDIFYKLHFDKASDGNPRDYIIVESGRKIGIDKLDNLYDETGAINQTPFTSDVRVDLDTFGYQVESSYSEGKSQTIGKQSRILATQDIYNMGVPFDTELTREQWTALPEAEKMKASDLYTKAKAYENSLNKLTEYGYNNLLNLFGIIDKGDSFKIEDYSILAETLRKEILKQAVSDNVKKAIQLDDNGQFPVAFEATNVYDKIKSIINSMVNRNLISQKVNGSPKTQVTSTLFERNNRQAVYKTKEGYKPVENISSLSEAEKKTIILTSNELKFYTTEKDVDGKITYVHHMEVYLPRWFANKTKLSDEELLKKLNNTKAGQAILKGIGFRIPTQKKNSIEAFIVKGFLPASMGDTIIVPSEITKKSGSDFDFDKLNTYLKNISFDKEGFPHISIITNFNTNNEDELKDFYEKHLLEQYKSFKIQEAEYSAKEAANILFSDIFSQEDDEFESPLIQKLRNGYVPSLDEFVRSAKGKDIYQINQEYNLQYKGIIENEFFQATEDLLLHPAMYERLIKPNEGGGQFKSIRDNVISAVGSDSGLIYPSMIDMIYRATMRHNASSAAGGIGIVATNITMYTSLQKIGAFLNRAVISKLSKSDRHFLPNVNIALKHNTLNNTPTLSAMKDVSGNYISDNMSNLADGMVDVTKDPWVTELFGDNSNVHSTAILLTILGVKPSSIGYFINQPIVREYLKSLSAQGKTYILDEELQEGMLDKFSSSYSTANKIDEKKLLSNIQKYYKDKKSLTGQEKAEQRFILNEFLKYVAIASNSYGFNSAIGYDNKNRGLTSFDNRKARTNREKDLNVISGIDSLLSDSFLGPLLESLDSTHTALAEVFPLLKKRMRDMFNSIKQSIDVKFMNSNTRNKIDEGIHRSFIDYILHTETRYFTQNIQKLLINHETAVSTRLLEAKDKLNNPFVNALSQIADRKNLLNIKLSKPDTEAFTANLYIAAFRQLKQQDKQLYDDLIKLAIIQSGTNRSKLSYSHLIPAEDYRLIAGDVISKLDINPDVNLFQINNAFFRNNWNDRKIVPNVNINKQGDIAAFSRVPASIRALGTQAGTNFIQVHPDFGNKSSYPVLKTVTYTRDNNGKSVPHITLYQKVMRDVQNQIPFITEEGQFIYKQINAWGDSIYLQEYYKSPRPSQYDNNTAKVDEVADDLIVNTYDKAVEKPIISEERIDEIIDALSAYGPADLPKLEDKTKDSCI